MRGIMMKKESYTKEEKQIVLDNINKDRLIHQNAIKGLDGQKANYSSDEKHKIIEKLNESRISKQKQEEIKEKRTENKEVYQIASKDFYRFIHMDRDYFIKISDCQKLSSRAMKVPLYYRNFAGYQKQVMMIKVEPYADKFYISSELIRVYYQTYALEDKKS
jgi:hypothetical protein